MGRFGQTTAIKRYDDEVLCEVVALNAVIITSWPDVKEMFAQNVFSHPEKPESKHLNLLLRNWDWLCFVRFVSLIGELIAEWQVN